MIVTQGHGRIGKLDVDCPSIIRFGQLTQDEVFISHEAAIAGVTFENHSETDPLVTLRYFGPEVHKDMPNVGDHARIKHSGRKKGWEATMRQQHFEETNSKIQEQFRELKKSSPDNLQDAPETFLEQLGIRTRDACRIGSNGSPRTRCRTSSCTGTTTDPISATKWMRR